MSDMVKGVLLAFAVAAGGIEVKDEYLPSFLKEPSKTSQNACSLQDDLAAAKCARQQVAMARTRGL